MGLQGGPAWLCVAIGLCFGTVSSGARTLDTEDTRAAAPVVGQPRSSSDAGRGPAPESLAVDPMSAPLLKKALPAMMAVSQHRVRPPSWTHRLGAYCRRHPTLTRVKPLIQWGAAIQRATPSSQREAAIPCGPRLTQVPSRHLR